MRPQGSRRGARAAAIAAILAVVAAVVVAIVVGHPPARVPARAASKTVTRTAGVAAPRHRRRAPAFRGATIAGAAARRVAVPILMYHVIAPAPAGTPFPQLWVPPHAFDAQVRALARAGYTGVTLGEVFAAWRHGARLPRRPVVLSFDDGYSSDATRAAPVLRRLGWPGVLDLAIRNAGPRGIHVTQLRRLVRDGWEIDSHTVHHVDMTAISARARRRELDRSRAWIRRRLHVRAPFFCYPAGRFDAAVVAAVRRAGYRGATTEVPGVANARSNPYELPRLRVMATTRPRQLQSLSAGSTLSP